MSATKVTAGQWKAVLGDPVPIEPVDRADDYAVDKPSWLDAERFCQALSKKEGRVYRLPTEAEWEYCCRAGTTTAWYTGNDPEQVFSAAWISRDDWDARMPGPVACLLPNNWGLYDMHGTVCEFCQDWYGPYPTGQATDPRPHHGDGACVARRDLAAAPPVGRSASRRHVVVNQANHMGFRVVLESPAPDAATRPTASSAPDKG